MTNQDGLTSGALAKWLKHRRATDVVFDESDYRLSISKGIVRGHLNGAVVGGAGVDVEHRLNSVTDLLSIALGEAAGGTPAPAHAYVAVKPTDTEIQVALQTLQAVANDNQTKLDVTLVDHSELAYQLTGPAPDFKSDDEHKYTRWAAQLERQMQAVPPAIVCDLVEAVNAGALHGLRAYPSLSRPGSWSLRYEGLSVGTFTARRGTLGVGTTGKTGENSTRRALWIETTGLTDPEPVTATDLGPAADQLRAFAEAFSESDVDDEHALESRILRGAVRVPRPGSSSLLSPIKIDPVVAWGSQFPTRWGPRDGAGRYLDALLRDGRTPWALEIKVASGGTAQYYRHAVHQAVLYRHFIRTATPLHAWFDFHDLDQKNCEAAVVIPADDDNAKLESIAKCFGIHVITVPRVTARYGWRPEA